MTTEWDLTLNIKSTHQILFFEIVNNAAGHCDQMFQHCHHASWVLNLWCRKSHRGVKTKTAAHKEAWYNVKVHFPLTVVPLVAVYHEMHHIEILTL